MKSNHWTYRSFAMILALMIFTSSTGLSIDMHFCQGHLRSLSFIGDAKSCVEKANSDLACKPLATSNQRKCCPIGCCQDKLIELDLAADQYYVIDAILEVQQEICQLFTQVEKIDESFSFEKHLKSPVQYKPPKIIERIYGLVESYRL